MHTNDVDESPGRRSRFGCATTVLLAAIALLIIAVGWLYVEVGRLKLPEEISVETVDRKVIKLRSDVDENSMLTTVLASDMTNLSSQTASLGADVSYLSSQMSSLGADLSYLSSQTSALASDVAYVGSIARNADNYAHSHTYSDGRLKQDITPIQNALANILTVSGVRFEWNRELREDLPVTMMV